MPEEVHAATPGGQTAKVTFGVLHEERESRMFVTETKLGEGDSFMISVT